MTLGRRRCRAFLSDYWNSTPERHAVCGARSPHRPGRVSSVGGRFGGGAKPVRLGSVGGRRHRPAGTTTATTTLLLQRGITRVSRSSIIVVRRVPVAVRSECLCCPSTRSRTADVSGCARARFPAYHHHHHRRAITRSRASWMPPVSDRRRYRRRRRRRRRRIRREPSWAYSGARWSGSVNGVPDRGRRLNSNNARNRSDRKRLWHHRSRQRRNRHSAVQSSEFSRRRQHVPPKLHRTGPLISVPKSVELDVPQPGGQVLSRILIIRI